MNTVLQQRAFMQAFEAWMAIRSAYNKFGPPVADRLPLLTRDLDAAFGEFMAACHDFALHEG